MRDMAVILVVCATACAARPAFVNSGDVPVSTCGPQIECTQGGGTSSLLVPVVALAAVAVFFTVAVFTDHPEHRSLAAPP
jgi:hypothetical protein